MNPESLRDMPIGSALKAARESRGWTQKELATRSGVNRAFLCCIESGRKYPTIPTVTKLSIALEIEVWRILRWAEKRQVIPSGISESDSALSAAKVVQ